MPSAPPKSAIGYAGATLSMTVQQDLHAVAGQHAALFAQAGPVRVIAAAGPASVQAHGGELELLAGQSVTASDEEVVVLAQTKLVLQAGQTSVTLEGGNITFACPGQFNVKANQHPFMGAENYPAHLGKLPDTRVKRLGQQFQLINELTGEPVEGMPYKLISASGDEYYRTTDRAGKTLRFNSITSEEVQVSWGLKQKVT